MSSSTLRSSNPSMRSDENSIIMSSHKGRTKSVAFLNSENVNHKTVNFGKTKTPLKTSVSSKNGNGNGNGNTPARRALGDISNRKKGLSDGGNGGNRKSLKTQGLKIVSTTATNNYKSKSKSAKKSNNNHKSSIHSYPVKKSVEAELLVSMKNVKIDDDDVSDIEYPAGGGIYDPMDDPVYCLPSDDECAIDIRLTREAISQLHHQVMKSPHELELQNDLKDLYRKEMEGVYTVFDEN